MPALPDKVIFKLLKTSLFLVHFEPLFKAIHSLLKLMDTDMHMKFCKHLLAASSETIFAKLLVGLLKQKLSWQSQNCNSM